VAVERPPARFDAEVPVAILGAGAAGLTAALACAEAGVEPLVIERDAVPRGSTALSAGLIPAAGTRWQRTHGIADDAPRFATDIQRKAKQRADPTLVTTIAREAAPTLEWLADSQNFAFSLVHDFDYPGHSARRMHGLASRSGAELIDRLRAAAEARDIPLLTEAHGTTLFAEADGTVRGLALARPDGSTETIGCRALILASSGYGGNRALVARHIPALSDALYFGHAGNTGEAALWCEALGAEMADMTGHQGHGSVAHPAGILVSWAVIMQGGFQLDTTGTRFWDESQGYSEAALAVLARPGGIAFDVFDERIAQVARQFEDFRNAESAGAVLAADSPDALDTALRLPTGSVARALAETRGVDRFGRDWRATPPLAAPFRAVRVTGALFHTQGGPRVDESARVLRPGAIALQNLFAAGGAACGVSGPEASGYLSGNGLVTAVVLGRLAGRAAARLC
jgi:fumarate reductase flavoprotein subunit